MHVFKAHVGEGERLMVSTMSPCSGTAWTIIAILCSALVPELFLYSVTLLNCLTASVVFINRMAVVCN